MPALHFPNPAVAALLRLLADPAASRGLTLDDWDRLRPRLDARVSSATVRIACLSSASHPSGPTAFSPIPAISPETCS